MKIIAPPRLAGRGLIKAYRYTLSPLVGFHCRHLPTCSEYADEALDRYGLWAGGWMTLARLVALPALGHVRHRPRAGRGAARRTLVCAVAFRAVVVARSRSMIFSETGTHFSGSALLAPVRQHLQPLHRLA